MKMCLQQEENMRLSADQLLQHEFISKFDKATTNNDFKSYLEGSNIDQLRKQKYKIELASIKQSLSELVKKEEMNKRETKEHLSLIKNILKK